MSSVHATVDGTVARVRRVGHHDATRAVTVVAAIAFAQLVWIIALVYGAIWLLT